VSEHKPIVLELNEVSLSYHAGGKAFDHGRHHVLQDVSMKLYEKETLGIIGRNGVGKTTLLRVMAGILAPTKGRVRMESGKSASLLTLGRDNALLAAMLQGSTQKQAISFLDDIKDFSELGDSFNEPVKNYSAGMRSRLAFTTALMTHVDVLLIDEILSVGDAHFRGKALTAMQGRIMGDQTVVFVSHMADQVEKMCDRVIWLENSKIVAEGDSKEITSAYTESVLQARNNDIEHQA
jgi:lipopolysaccharide transport system ATP-binding protein